MKAEDASDRATVPWLAVNRGAGEMTRHVVAKVDEIPTGGRKIVTVNGREIGIFNVGDGFFGVDQPLSASGRAAVPGRDRQPSGGAEPGDYRLTRTGEMLRCPWHCWEFDIRTGQSLCDPEQRAGSGL